MVVGVLYTLLMLKNRNNAVKDIFFIFAAHLCSLFLTLKAGRCTGLVNSLNVTN